MNDEIMGMPNRRFRRALTRAQTDSVELRKRPVGLLEQKLIDIRNNRLNPPGRIVAPNCTECGCDLTVGLKQVFCFTSKREGEAPKDETLCGECMAKRTAAARCPHCGGTGFLGGLQV